MIKKKVFDNSQARAILAIFVGGIIVLMTYAIDHFMVDEKKHPELTMAVIVAGIILTPVSMWITLRLTKPNPA
ncbi:MAG: hypothetical protein ACHQF2_03475 [Flavobacteriales bacterium]